MSKTTHLFKSQFFFFLISLLPSILILFWVIISLSSTGEAPSLSKTAAVIARETGILNNWKYIRNLTYLGYIILYIFQLVVIFTSKKSNPTNVYRNIIGATLKILLGMLLVAFSFFIGLILWEFASVIFIAFTNPNSIYQ